ncbi:MAG TPA: DNA-3-methyladenine glycosylase [Candidatus Nitrosotenuis sp.]|nr:DNA-3-methyladenine glycosylase [Candidatus Nitrosotenuis sp.]
MMLDSRLDREFYAQDTVKVARQLLGKILVRKIGRHIVSGIITETEAYRHKDDPASHAFGNMTDRNKAMFGDVGFAYVYFTYGMHYCMNVVAKSKNYKAGAVLIRALKPQQGIDIMIKNRGTDDVANLTNGPAKLTMAMQITKKQYGEDLINSNSLYITDGIKVRKIIAGPRVGIRNATDRLWNFKASI